MEPIRNILPGASLPPSSERTAAYSKSLERAEARQQALRALIIRLYASARKEIPSDDALEIEVRLAMADLKEIPEVDLAGAFREAQVAAGAFVPTNGQIVRAWRDGKAKGFDDAQKAIRLENSMRYLGAGSERLPTAEERIANAAAIAEIRRKMAQ